MQEASSLRGASPEKRRRGARCRSAAVGDGSCKIYARYGKAEKISARYDRERCGEILRYEAEAPRGGARGARAQARVSEAIAGIRSARRRCAARRASEGKCGKSHSNAEEEESRSKSTAI